MSGINRLSFIGIIRATVRDAYSGDIISQNHYFNTDTNYMRKTVAAWLTGTLTTTSAPPPTQIGAGNGIGTPAATDTTLWSPIAGTQRVCDNTMTTQGYYAQYNITYQTADPNGAYTEVGLFDANNNLWAHASINEIKSGGQTLTVQWMVMVASDTSNSNAIVTNYARSTIANWLTGVKTTTSGVPPTKMQLGSGTGTLALADTALWTPTTGTLVQCPMIYASAQYNAQFSATYTSADPAGNYTEAGLFDSGGNLWFHAKLTNANKTDGQVLAILFQIAVNGN